MRLGKIGQLVSKVLVSPWTLIDNFSDGDYSANPMWGNGGTYPGFSVSSSKLIGASPTYSLYTPFGTGSGGTWATSMSWTSGLLSLGFMYSAGGFSINPRPLFYYGIQVDGSTLYITQGHGGTCETCPATYTTVASTAWAPGSGTYHTYRIQWDRVTGTTTVYVDGISKLTGTLALSGGTNGAVVFTTGTAGWTNFYFNSSTTATASPIG